MCISFYLILPLFESKVIFIMTVNYLINNMIVILLYSIIDAW